MAGCGWWWPFKNAVVLTERPSSLFRDQAGRLHNSTSAAISYPDGWSIHSINGVRVPAYVVEKPETITCEIIDAEKNAEVKRIMIERYGQERYLLDSKAEQIHEDEFGTLYKKDIPGDEPLVMVMVNNSTPEPDGSTKQYFLRVPPTITRAKEAVAWTFDIPEKEYELEFQS